MLSKEASSTIFWVFGMTRPGIELRSSGPLANTLAVKQMEQKYIYKLDPTLLTSDYTSTKDGNLTAKKKKKSVCGWFVVQILNHNVSG